MTIRYLLLLRVLGVTVAPAFAQGRFSVGLTAAPVLNDSYSNVTFKVPYGSGQLTDTTFDFRSTIGGFSAGLSIGYTFSPTWRLSTGVWFTQLRTTQPFPFAPGNVPSRVVSSAYQIPLLFHYRPTNRRLSPYFSLGALAVLRGATRYRSVRGSNIRDTQIRFGGPLNVQAVVGAGVAYRLTPRWSTTIEPLLIWRFQPKQSDLVRYNQYVIYQVQGQVRLDYSF